MLKLESVLAAMESYSYNCLNHIKFIPKSHSSGKLQTRITPKYIKANLNCKQNLNHIIIMLQNCKSIDSENAGAYNLKRGNRKAENASLKIGKHIYASHLYHLAF